jgi:SAM-dependent methyltransferase
MSDTEALRDWELNAFLGRDSESDMPRMEPRTESGVAFYNKPFVDFLVSFYGLHHKRILDYGCGSGWAARLFSNYSKQVYGTNISAFNPAIPGRTEKQRPVFFQDDFFDSHLPHNSYDFLFCRGLGPLNKIEYSKANETYLKALLAALRSNGVAYFILNGNLTGVPDSNKLAGFRNHTLQTIHDFFSSSARISMINVFGYQSVVVTKDEKLAAFYNKKMFRLVSAIIENLGDMKWDYLEYLKCRLWLFVNRMEDLRRAEFAYVDKYIDRVLGPSLTKGVCAPRLETSATESEEQILWPYLLSADQDRFFEKVYAARLQRESITLIQFCKDAAGTLRHRLLEVTQT